MEIGTEIWIIQWENSELRIHNQKSEAGFQVAGRGGKRFD